MNVRVEKNANTYSALKVLRLDKNSISATFASAGTSRNAGKQDRVVVFYEDLSGYR